MSFSSEKTKYCELKVPVAQDIASNVVDNSWTQQKVDEELLDKAKAELSNLLPGEVFLVHDLFKGYE